MKANVQAAVTEDFNPRCATNGMAFKDNLSTLTATRPAVGDEGGIACRRCAKGVGGVEIGEEYRFAAARAANIGPIIDDSCIACRRAPEEPPTANVVEEAFEGCDTACRAAHCRTIVDDG